jgi:predicted nucleotidyltransferase
VRDLELSIRDALLASAITSLHFALLIGSVATGSAGPLSDIDIAVYLDPELDREGMVSDILRIGVELEKKLRTENVDVVNLNEASPSMKFNAVKTGIEILVRDEGEYEDFVIRALSEYYDHLEFLEQQYRYAVTVIAEDGTR